MVDPQGRRHGWQWRAAWESKKELGCDFWWSPFQPAFWDWT